MRRQDLDDPHQKAIQRNTYRHLMIEDDQDGLPFSNEELGDITRRSTLLEESKDEIAIVLQEE